MLFITYGSEDNFIGLTKRSGIQYIPFYEFGLAISAITNEK